MPLSPPKYPSTKHWPWSQTVHRDDTVHDNPEMFVGREVVVTEKLDGGNTCLFRGEVYARSVDSPSTAGWMAMVKKHHGWKLAHRMEWGWAIYGEDLYGIHSIEYDPMLESETYHVFAVRDTSCGREWFESWDSVNYVAGLHSLPVVPEVYRGTFDSVGQITEFFEDELQRPSSLGPEREGFVMRIAEGFQASVFELAVCKYVRKDHVQTDEHWTRNWQPCRLRKE